MPSLPVGSKSAPPAGAFARRWRIPRRRQTEIARRKSQQAYSNLMHRHKGDG